MVDETSDMENLQPEPDEPRPGKPAAETDSQEPAERPRTVTNAGLILLTLPVVGVIGMVAAGIAVAEAQDTAGTLVARLTADGVEEGQRLVDDMLSAMWLQLGVTAVVGLGQAIVLGVLAFHVVRGSRRARTTVFALAALSAVAVVWLIALTVAQQRLRARLDALSDLLGFRTVYETDVIPGWFPPVNYGLFTVSALMVAAAVWLLTRPEANAYFGPRPAAPSPARARLRLVLGALAAVIVISVPATVLSAVERVPDVPDLPKFPNLGALPEPGASPLTDPSRKVVFMVEIFGLVGNGNVGYTTSDRGYENEPMPAGLPAFVRAGEFTHGEGSVLTLNATAWGPADSPLSGIPPHLRCSIHINGVLSAVDSNLGICNVTFPLDEFTGVAVKPSPVPSPTPSQTKAAAQIPDCQYLSPQQVGDVVARAGGLPRRVPTVGEGFLGCEYAFKGDRYVEIEWTEGRRMLPGTEDRVFKLDGRRAIWDSEETYLSLELPTGMLFIRADLEISERKARQIVMELMKLVRPQVS
ncbi:hypothetical protein [Paractinoplanes abujensis]|uniref:Uncharacterized protein n=1 Tax=Paractinoplanes abujensis TaxID=882441 RepID=A0A7W7CRW7_9ACTN|nr:hypothetical protein [Actinoplanes abujensis]MBB4693567.1 hypothetical protein [Actinoplanes abujensis]